MRILYLVHQYPPEHLGGTELYTRQLAGALQGRGHQVDVVYRAGGEQASLEGGHDAGGVRLWAASSGPVTASGRFWATFGDQTLESALELILEETRPELAHVQHLLGWPASVARQLRRRHIPLLITLHDFWWVCANAQLVTNYSQALCQGPRAWVNCARCSLARAGQDRWWPLSPLLAPLLAARHARLRPLWQQAAAIVAPSAFVRDVHLRLGLPGSKMHLIRHGISLPERLPRAPRPLGRGLHLGYVGGLSWQKGVHVLLEALRELPAEVRLTVVGDPAAFPAYSQALGAQGQRHGVHFAGKVPHEQVWRYLAQFDLLVVPSLWYEAAGLVIQEAFAAGVPVVVSDLGALPESVQPGVDGLLFPPGDVPALRALLLGLLRQPERLAVLQAGIRPVRTMAGHVADLEGLYGQVLAASPA